MAWIERLRALWPRQAGRQVGDGDPEAVRIVLRMPQAGVRVTPDTAFKSAVVWACVTYLARTVAQLPWRVLVERNGREERLPRNGVAWLLNTRPNPEMGAFAWRECMVGWAARWGNAVAEITRDGARRPTGLWPIHPERVTFERDAATGELLYVVRHDVGGEVELRADQVFHLRGFGEGPIGLNVVQYAAESIGLAQAAELFGASYFGNGINPSVKVELPSKLSPDALRELKDELKQLYSGPRNAQKAVVLDGGMKLEPITTQPDNAQFIETRQHQVEEICRWFGVPPHKVQHLLRSTNNNIEHQSIEVVTDAIVPWCKRLEEEADAKLFSPVSSIFSKLDLKGLLRGDFKSRAEGLQIMRRNGVINADEWRQLEEMNEIPGGLGAKYTIEANMTTLERVGEAPAAAPAAP